MVFVALWRLFALGASQTALSVNLSWQVVLMQTCIGGLLGTTDCIYADARQLVLMCDAAVQAH